MITLKMADLVIQGIDPEALIQLRDLLGLSVQGIADFVDMSKSTLTRRTAKHQLLNQKESERVLRFLRLFRKAVSIFKTNEATLHWFQTEIKALGDKTPYGVLEDRIAARAAIAPLIADDAPGGRPSARVCLLMADIETADGAEGAARNGSRERRARPATRPGSPTGSSAIAGRPPRHRARSTLSCGARPKHA